MTAETTTPDMAVAIVARAEDAGECLASIQQAVDRRALPAMVQAKVLVRLDAVARELADLAGLVAGNVGAERGGK